MIAVVFAALAVSGFISFFGGIGSLQRVSVPGQGTVTLSKAGDYWVYLEGPGFGNLADTGAVSVTIVSSTGQAVPVRQLGSEHVNYSFGSYSGQSGGSFTISTPGRYTVTTGVPQNPAMTDVAIGPGGLLSSILWPVLSVLVAGLAFVSAIVVLIITIVRRRSGQRMAAAGMPGFYPGAPPPQAWNQQDASPPWNQGPGGPGSPA